MEGRALRRAGAAVACLATVLVAAGVVRAESRFPLTVRLYNATTLPPEGVAAARQAAEPVLRDTGLDVTFRYCGTRPPEGASVDRCDDPLRPHEVVVRILPAPVFNPALHPGAFGVTYVIRDTDQGWLATVFADRILSAAGRVGVEGGTLLGFVIAHEIGHLLLGQRYHGDSGLMRAEWTDALLARETTSEWHFTMEEAAVIQQRVLAR